MEFGEIILILSESYSTFSMQRTRNRQKLHNFYKILISAYYKLTYHRSSRVFYWLLKREYYANKIYTNILWEHGNKSSSIWVIIKQFKNSKYYKTSYLSILLILSHLQIINLVLKQLMYFKVKKKENCRKDEKKMRKFLETTI